MRLAEHHRHVHEVGSAIEPDLLDGGVFTITRGDQLPRGFSPRQRNRAPGVLYKVPRPNGKMAWVFRPDEADPKKPGLRYEATCKKLGGPGNVLYVHPSQRHLIGDTGVPVIFVEGIKKALSIITAARAAGVEVLVVGILGVWNWMADKKPIADMLEIPLDGRQVFNVFDDDVFVNPDVADALRRLARYERERGAAAVKVAYLPASADGSKTGADDFLARGHGYLDLLATFRPFDPDDLAAERLKRGEKLRAMLGDLARTLWESEWKGIGGHSARDVLKVLVDLALTRGKLHEDGLRVKVSRSELAKMAKVSTRTLQKAIERLEEMGLIYRDNESRRPRERGAFVLRATVNRYREGPAAAETTKDFETEATLGSLQLRAPRLMWSSPAFKGLRGTVTGTRKVRQGPPPEPRPAIKRLGKVRGAALDVLDAAGGVSNVGEIYDALHPGKPPDKRRPRDLVRRKKTEKGRDGLLVMLEGSGILEIDGDVVTLTDNWLEALDEQRQLGKEIDSTDVAGHVAAGAATVARRRLEAKGRAFREWSNETLQVSGHWANNPDADGHVEDLERIGTALSEPDSRILEAIEAFECKYGRGSFRWDRASCKELFYSGPIEGFWPEPEELRRIRDYLVATRGIAA
jgi:DNA-binding transcriptional ArsR family regulator